MELIVVSVGDGACSTVQSAPNGAVMIVDCGTTGNGGIPAAETLRTVLGRDARNIRTVVVTHFDSDHWSGLRDLARRWDVDVPTGPVEFRYPRFLPDAAGLVQKAHLVTQAIRIGGPVSAALDLTGAWERSGVKVVRRPSSRGMGFFGGGQAWAVHWPPADVAALHGRTRSAIDRLADRVAKIASDVPEFDEALGIVERVWSGDGVGDPQSELTAEELEAALQDALPAKELSAVARRLAYFTNVLSIVHSNTKVANFGDCEGAGLAALLRLEDQNPKRRTSYPVVLAPHHGTSIPRPQVQALFPKACCALVSQNGKIRYQAGIGTGQQAFKRKICSASASQMDTYNPALQPSLLGPHLMFSFT
jgi:hypothetical protein